MSKRLGWVQLECLRVIRSYEDAGWKPTTFTIAAEVYQVERDQYGIRMINDAQHVATKRALAGLRRKGLVTGQQDLKFESDGTKSFSHARRLADGSYGHRVERCCFWSIVRAAD